MMILYVIAMVCLITEIANAEYQKLSFEKSPLGAGLDGLECALAHYDKRLSRGVKVNSKTGACNNLTESWFSNQTVEGNHSYFKLVMGEPIFEPTKYSVIKLPYRFVVGSSIVFYVKLGTLARVQSFMVNIMSPTNDFCYHTGIRFWSGRFVFNTKRNNKWGQETSTVNPFKESDTTYRSEVRVTSKGFSIYIDDDAAPYHVFPHRLDISTCDSIELISTIYFVDFERFQFFYPV